MAYNGWPIFIHWRQSVRHTQVIFIDWVFAYFRSSFFASQIFVFHSTRLDAGIANMANMCAVCTSSIGKHVQTINSFGFLWNIFICFCFSFMLSFTAHEIFGISTNDNGPTRLSGSCEIVIIIDDNSTPSFVVYVCVDFHEARNDDTEALHKNSSIFSSCLTTQMREMHYKLRSCNRRRWQWIVSAAERNTRHMKL